MILDKIIFITGGVRSGKSAFAERYAQQLFQKKQTNLYYLASGVGFDDEMKKRILRHQEDRLKSNMPWTTIEVETELPSTTFQIGDIILWDCITTWLNNVLYVTESFEHERTMKIHQIIKLLQTKVIQWRNDGATVILVSNEVLDEPTSTFKEVNLYRELLGKLHQWIVSTCDEAYELDYSISVRRK